MMETLFSIYALFKIKRILLTFYPYMKQSSQFQNPSVVLKRVTEVIQKNKSSDLFHKAFLRPQEIALKTWRTQKDKTKLHDALPYGLKQAIKRDISLNKYVLKDFEPFESLDPSKRTIQYVNENNCDNLISLIKPRGQGQRIKLCICICMYSENKTMLRKTLAGVSNNIATFVRNGISSDDIVVAVVMDGIEKVDASVVDFFNEMEKQSNIYLDEDDAEPLEAREIIKDEMNQVDEEEVININNFIFDQVQLEDRKKRRFCERKREYEQVKSMSSKIDKLQMNKKITYDDLDDFLKPFFLEKAKERKKKEYADQDFSIEKINEQDLIREYADNIKISRPIIFEALGEAKSYCETYIQTRESLALLNSFRFGVTFGSFDQVKKNKDQYQNLPEEKKTDPSIKMNLLFITKYKNSGKLSSHNWFFNGLCREIKSEFAVLLDVGLCPEKTALYKMFNHMRNDPKCGGVCGYMNLRIERLEDDDEKHFENIDCLSRLFMHVADIQRAQQVEYHFAHLIDKPFEALFKFIHVLPGAFSAYRMKALQPSEQEDSKLLREYFKSLEQSTSRELKKVQYSTGKAILKVLLPDFLYYCCYPASKELTDEQLLYDSNVYLAEDRTLCMGIHQNGYELQYLPDSHAWVDPIKNLHSLLGQRKRWINGSFFAFQSVKRGLGQQSTGDCCLKLQIFYLTLMNMLAFVSPALFLFTIHISMFAFRDWFFGYVLNNLTSTEFRTTQFYNSFVFVIDFIYVMLMFGFIFKSIHFTHITKRFIPYIYTMSTIMGIFAFVVFLVLIVDMITGIVDSIKCLTSTNGVCEITFLAQVPALRKKFFQVLPGGLLVFMIYKWLLVGVMSLYIVPIVVYALFYCRCQFIADVLFGTVSYIFYTPTYLNMLNTFALCRIDDISWGTKGLDTEDHSKKELKESWKSIKMLHVAKFIFWNIVVGAILLVISSPINLQGLITTDQYNDLLISSYVRKFFMTLFLMVIIGFALFLKIFLGAIYSICYRCSRGGSDKKILNSKNPIGTSKVESYFGQVKSSLYNQVSDYVRGMVDNVRKKKFTKGIEVRDLKSLIVANKKVNQGASRKKAEEKWKNNVQTRSKITKKKEDMRPSQYRRSEPQYQSLMPNQNVIKNNQDYKLKLTPAPPRRAPLTAEQYSKQMQKSQIKSNRTEEQLISETELKKSDLENSPYEIQAPKSNKKLFGIF